MYRQFTVKSCGIAHPYCGKCKPEVSAARRKPPKPLKERTKACLSCGRCDVCLGLVAPEGMKQCRKCGEVKPVALFYKRSDTSGHRNHCNTCRNRGLNTAVCETCGRRFTRAAGSTHTRCSTHRNIEARNCRECQQNFMPRYSTVYYCSSECLGIATKRGHARVWAENKLRALQAYGGSAPSCACCQESTSVFLSLDHIDGGGRQQRAEKGGGGFMTWLKANNYPPGFQVLCHNCNMGRQLNGGICPHKT